MAMLALSILETINEAVDGCVFCRCHLSRYAIPGERRLIVDMVTSSAAGESCSVPPPSSDLRRDKEVPYLPHPSP